MNLQKKIWTLHIICFLLAPFVMFDRDYTKFFLVAVVCILCHALYWIHITFAQIFFRLGYSLWLFLCFVLYNLIFRQQYQSCFSWSYIYLFKRIGKCLLLEYLVRFVKKHFGLHLASPLRYYSCTNIRAFFVFEMLQFLTVCCFRLSHITFARHFFVFLFNFVSILIHLSNKMVVFWILFFVPQSLCVDTCTGTHTSMALQNRHSL